MNLIAALFLTLACAGNEPTTNSTAAVAPPASEPTPSPTPTLQTSTGASVLVRHPSAWKCEESTFTPREQIVATIGGVVTRAGEAGHQLYCSSRSEEHPAAISIQRFTIGSDLAADERFQLDLDETEKAILAFTKPLTPIGDPVSIDVAGCNGRLVEHRVMSLETERERHHILCSHNGVAYNIVAFGTEGKAWTEAQSILESLTFK